MNPLGVKNNPPGRAPRTSLSADAIGGERAPNQTRNLPFLPTTNNRERLGSLGWAEQHSRAKEEHTDPPIRARKEAVKLRLAEILFPLMSCSLPTKNIDVGAAETDKHLRRRGLFDPQNTLATGAVCAAYGTSLAGTATLDPGWQIPTLSLHSRYIAAWLQHFDLTYPGCGPRRPITRFSQLNIQKNTSRDNRYQRKQKHHGIDVGLRLLSYSTTGSFRLW